MQESEPAAVQPYMLARGEGDAFWFLGTRMYMKATGETTGGAFGLIEQELPPGFASPLHVHRAEDEPFYILEGEVTFTCGGDSFAASAGSFVFLPRGVAHGFEVTGGGPARLLQLNLPAGVERFFQEAGEPAREGASEPEGPPDLDKVTALAGKYGMELLGPPGSR